MKIIQVVPVFELGGAEIMCENLVYELKKMGHEVIVISLYNNHTVITQRFEDAGINIKYLDKKSGLDLSLFKKLWSILKSEKPDVIHTHLYTTKYIFPLAALLKIRVVHTVHSVATKEMSTLSRKVNSFFFRFFNVVPVALSNNIKKTIIDEYKLDEKNVPVILNGIDLNKCNVKIDYSINKVFNIVHVGSFQEVKNHIGLIDAFEKFNKKYPNSELHLIGDGAGRLLIEQIVSDKNLTKQVKFYGSQPNVHKFLCKMDVFTLPSLYEGIPMSIIEAMGTGLPIVATKVGGIPDMLDENSALLVQVDTDAIEHAFESYYCSEILRKQHGLAALALSVNFSSLSMAEKYVELYLGRK